MTYYDHASMQIYGFSPWETNANRSVSEQKLHSGLEGKSGRTARRWIASLLVILVLI